MTDEIELWKGAPAERQSNGLAMLRTALLRLDDERKRLAEAGDYESLSAGGQDIQTLTDELTTLLRDTRLDVARIVDQREVARRIIERSEREQAGKPPKKSIAADKALGRVREEIDGVGVVEVNGGFDRKNWESEKLLRRMLHIALDGFSIFTPDGTDARDDVIARLMEVLTDVMPVTGSLQWRVGQSFADKDPTGLKKYQIWDDEEWCDRTPKPRLASFPRNIGAR